MTEMPTYDEGRKIHNYVESDLILGLLREIPQGMTCDDIASTCNVHYTTARRKLNGLVYQRLVYVSHTVRTGQRGAPTKMYKAVME